MDWNEFETHFSPARVTRYKQARNGDEARAQEDYKDNILLAESLMPMLNTLEIALRNGIHRQLSKATGRCDWWNNWINNAHFQWQNKQISQAISKLQNRSEPITPDKIVAELTFGFWASLFNSQFQHILWANLRLVFPKCPKKQRQRHTISSALSQMRDLRNRVFHHEPILWLNPTVDQQYHIGMTTIGWLNPDLAMWITSFDRFPDTHHQWVTKP